MTKRLFAIVIVIFLWGQLWSQEGSYYETGFEKYRKAVELFEKEKFASARNVFEDYIEHDKKDHHKLFVDAHYYRALCAMELFNKDAEYLLENFMQEFPESPRVRELYFVMGNFQYRKKKYRKAINWYDKVDIYKLTDKEVEEYNFKYAYSNFKKEKEDIASEYFIKNKDGDSKYAAPSKYFYAHIAFNQKKYETALKDFKALEEDDLFGPVVPYYIVQIYYFQNENEALINYAPLLLDSSSTRRIPEISRLLGEAYYKTNRFAQAVPYLEVFKEQGDNYERSDAYGLAYAYYRAKDFEKASQNFEDIYKRQDSISQNTFYHLADCYLQLEQKDKALLAFQEASSLDIIPEVQEDAMYNYAKLSYELSYSPFNDAISALKDYIKKYPNSKHHDKAYSYLSKVFLSTKNYQLAIETIEEIGAKTPEIQESYQKVCYFRALEYYNDGKYTEAVTFFNKSLDNSKFNLKIRALTKYWRAEAHYKLEAYEEAFNDFNDFVLTSGAFGSEQYKDAHYSMGYALFKLRDYKKAIVWFRKFTDFTASEKLTKVADAYNRTGDCYFISKNYRFAINYYDKSIELKRRQIDYAYFQKGFSLGLLKQYEQEIEVLHALIQNFENSSYIDDAVFEIANAYKYLNAYEVANENYSKIIRDYKTSEYRPKAYLQAGMIDYNADKDTLAIRNFKSLISQYPKSDEAQKALLIMRNIYIDINDVDSYIAFANNNSVETEVTLIEADSLTYISAENLYMDGNCDQSKLAFKKYITKYPEGKYLLNANYYKSDCEFAAKEYESALESYDYIVSLNSNEYTEDALLKAAYITYKDGNYTEALSFYSQLVSVASNNTSLMTAKLGLMRTNFRLEDYSATIKTALSVLIFTEDNNLLEREVHYVIGKSFYETKDYEGAYAEFTLIADQAKSEMGAEANYRMIEIKYKNNEYDEAIKLINSFKDSHSPHQKWVAKSFMIWSDIFMSKEDYFMAKATLESIIKYYPNQDDGVKKEAENKLVNIQEIEIENEELIEASEIEINMFDSEENELFEEDEPVLDLEINNAPDSNAVNTEKLLNENVEDLKNTEENSEQNEIDNSEDNKDETEVDQTDKGDMLENSDKKELQETEDEGELLEEPVSPKDETNINKEESLENTESMKTNEEAEVEKEAPPILNNTEQKEENTNKEEVKNEK